MVALGTSSSGVFLVANPDATLATLPPVNALNVTLPLNVANTMVAGPDGNLWVAGRQPGNTGISVLVVNPT